jgi:hypothetical protein
VTPAGAPRAKQLSNAATICGMSFAACWGCIVWLVGAARCYPVQHLCSDHAVRGPAVR